MLRTLVAALVVEMAMLILLYVNSIPGPALLTWYRQLGPSALTMDVLSAYVCVHAANMIAGPDVRRIVLCTLAIQIAHDLGFGYLLASVPRGTMKVLDLFQDYARPAILGYDAAIVLSVLLADRALVTNTEETLTLVGAVATYVSLIFVHSF